MWELAYCYGRMRFLLIRTVLLRRGGGRKNSCPAPPTRPCIKQAINVFQEDFLYPSGMTFLNYSISGFLIELWHARARPMVNLLVFKSHFLLSNNILSHRRVAFSVLVANPPLCQHFLVQRGAVAHVLFESIVAMFLRKLAHDFVTLNFGHN